MRNSIDAADERGRRPAARGSSTPAASTRSPPTSASLLAAPARRPRPVPASSTRRRSSSAKMRGGVSGGTVDSLRGQLDAAKADKSLRKVMVDPYALSPDRAAEPDPATSATRWASIHDEELGGWLAPFVMGTVNSRVVRRSNALQGYAYGRELRYRELMLTGGAAARPGQGGRDRRRDRGAGRRPLAAADPQAARPAAARSRAKGPSEAGAREGLLQDRRPRRRPAPARRSSAGSTRPGTPATRRPR